MIWVIVFKTNESFSWVFNVNLEQWDLRVIILNIEITLFESISSVGNLNLWEWRLKFWEWYIEDSITIVRWEVWHLGDQWLSPNPINIITIGVKIEVSSILVIKLDNGIKLVTVFILHIKNTQDGNFLGWVCIGIVWVVWVIWVISISIWWWRAWVIVIRVGGIRIIVRVWLVSCNYWITILISVKKNFWQIGIIGRVINGSELIRAFWWGCIWFTIICDIITIVAIIIGVIWLNRYTIEEREDFSCGSVSLRSVNCFVISNEFCPYFFKECRPNGSVLSLLNECQWFATWAKG